MTSANLTVALPTADATVGAKTDCRLSDDEENDTTTNDIKFVVLKITSFLKSGLKCHYRYTISGLLAQAPRAKQPPTTLRDSPPSRRSLTTRGCRCKILSTRFRVSASSSCRNPPLLRVSPAFSCFQIKQSDLKTTSIFRQHGHPALHHPAVHCDEPEPVPAAHAHGHRRRKGEEDQGEHAHGRTQGLCILGSWIQWNISYFQLHRRQTRYTSAVCVLPS